MNKEERLQLIEIRENIESRLFKKVTIENVEKAIRELTLEQKLSPRFSAEVANYMIEKHMDGIIKNLGIQKEVEGFKREELFFPSTPGKFQQKVREKLGKLESNNIVRKYDWYEHRKANERPRYIAKAVYSHTGKKYKHGGIIRV